MEKLTDLVALAKEKTTKTLAVACGEDPHTIEAVAKGVKEGVIEATLVGNKDKIKSVAATYDVDTSLFNIIHEPVSGKALKTAVKLVKEGKCNFLMKGLMDSSKYMRAILDKQEG